MLSTYFKRKMMSAPPTTTSMKADTGATGHFIAYNRTNLPLNPVSPVNPAIKVILPNGATMESTHTTTLPIPSLPSQATTAHAFPTLASGSLLSVGKLCDQNCTAVFTKKQLEIHKNQNIKIITTQSPLLTGSRNPPLRPLWSINLSKTFTQTLVVNAVVHTPSIRNRVAFYHAAMFSPTISTWTNAVRNKFLTSWPTLTVS